MSARTAAPVFFSPCVLYSDKARGTVPGPYNAKMTRPQHLARRSLFPAQAPALETDMNGVRKKRFFSAPVIAFFVLALESNIRAKFKVRIDENSETFKEDVGIIRNSAIHPLH